MEGSTRLMKNGSYPWREGEGFVEICMMGEWRSVCDDGWDMNAAMVVCREHDMLTEGRVHVKWCMVIKFTSFVVLHPRVAILFLKQLLHS